MNDWLTCDGKGGTNDAAPAARPRPTRRQALLGTALAALGLHGGRTALAQVALRPGNADPDGAVLVVLFLRGGADGLGIVPPYGDDAYHRLRPTIGLGNPTLGSAATLDLDGFYGLHPALSALHPHYREGSLAVVHACGSGDQTRSHFEAMATMERGVATESAAPSSGWLGRYLNATPERSGSPLRAVAFGAILPDSLRGATGPATIASLDDFRLDLPDGLSPERREALSRTLTAFYDGGSDAIAEAGRETLQVLETLRRHRKAPRVAAQRADYPETALGAGLRQVATLLRARVGMEIACLDRGGWDTHVAQGGATGWLALQLKDVGDSLAAFARDLGPEMARVTVVVQTEFGRRARENSGLGTDHGRGSVMLLLGGGVAGGKVYARWPGLDEGRLEPPGDLRVTTDYRDVLSEIVRRRLNCPDTGAVFPGYAPKPVEIIRATGARPLA